MSSILNISNVQNEYLNKVNNVVQEENSSLIELRTEIAHTSENVTDNFKVRILK